VRHALYMPAMVALKCNPLMKVFAERLKGDGLAPKAVIAACIHKLIRQIYGVLKSRNAFDANFLGNRLDFQNDIGPRSGVTNLGYAFFRQDSKVPIK